MKEFSEDSGQFKMRMDDEIEPSPITAHVDELRIEKLSHRMTLITILIPVLIVVVLVMTYMDIKRRVVQTEDTGQLTAQTLSEDLESRFSKLSLGQALIEENLTRFKDQTNESMAKVQVNLKKMGENLNKSSKSMASRKDMNVATSKLDKGMGEVSQSLDTLRSQLAELDTSIQPKLVDIDQSLSEDRSRVEQMEQRVAGVEENKLDKAAMDLALKLEILKLKQSLKVQMEEIQSQLQALQSKVDKQAAQAARRQAAPAPPTPSAPATPSSSPASNAPGALKEQNIQ